MLKRCPLIKICGIRTPAIAQFAALAGAHFIGIVFHPASRRCVSLEQAILISAAARSHNAIPVAVFVDHTALQMKELCEVAQIQVIQLHGRIARQQHHLLPSTYQRIYVRPVAPNGSVIDDDGGLIYCDPARDYLLFDNAEAGKGKPFNWDAFNEKNQFRIGFAGGLTPDNVVEAIEKFRPALVDVSSGVENASGEKDRALIQQFIGVIHE